MKTLFNAMFSIVIISIILGPCALFVLEKGQANLPSWMTGVDAMYLSGDISKSRVEECVSLTGFRDGALQKEVERSIDRRVPFKAKVMFANADAQRMWIRASNLLFGWSSFPAYYGSDVAVDVTTGQLLEIPKANDQETREKIDEVAKELDSLATKWGGDVYLYVVPEADIVSDLPIFDLVSNALSYQEISALFKREALAVDVVDGRVTANEYRNGWFGTDHHWKAAGALKAYREIAEAMRLPDVLSEEQLRSVNYEEPIFYGSLTRRALLEGHPDTIDDILVVDQDDLRVSIGDETGSIDLLVHPEIYENRAWWQQRYASRYAEYYHLDYGMIEIDNQDANDKRELLIVADSFSNCMERFLAESFLKTYVLDPRHYDGTVDDFLAGHEGITDVLVLMSLENLTTPTTIGAFE